MCVCVCVACVRSFRQKVKDKMENGILMLWYKPACQSLNHKARNLVLKIIGCPSAPYI